jgi:hypothetical protein
MTPQRLQAFCHSVFVIVIVLVHATQLHAQTEETTIPRLLSFQGVLIQPDGTVYPDGQYVISVKLFSSPTGGSLVYSDEMSTAVIGGVFNLIIGEQITLKDVDFTQQLWLEIGLPGTAQQAFLPRTKLTSAPYAMAAHSSVVAGGLAPNAKGAVLSVNGASGNLNVSGSGGLVITRSGTDINIDASSVVGNITITTLDSVIRITSPSSSAVKLGVNDSSIASRHLRSTGVTPGTYGDSTHIPRITVGKDGRITSISTQPLTVVTMPIASGRYVNTTPNRQYSVTINTQNSAPVAIESLLATARILVTMESSVYASSCVISNRTPQGFTIDFTGGLPPNAAFNWIVLNL